MVWFFLFLALLILGGCNGEDERFIPITGSSIKAFDDEIISFIQTHDVPAAAYAIIREGRLVLAAGYGYADLASTEPTRPDHLFRVASISKPITAVAALKAAENGQLELDTPIHTLLSDHFAEGGPADQRFLEITPRHLLSHTSGINQELLLRTREVASEMNAANPPDADVIVSYSTRLPLGYAPGSDVTYTNTSYTVLGRVIERATGMPYEDYVRLHVFAPGSISRARIGGSQRSERLDDEVEYDSRGNLWTSIFPNEKSVEAAYGAIHLHGFDASSGWVMSVIDLARFAASVDGHKGVPDILSQESLVEMATNRTPPGSSIGAGWFIGTIEVEGQQLRLLDHSGGMPGTTSYLGIREDGFIVAAVLNTWKENGDLFDAFIGSFNSALSAVESWPEVDLFSRAPPVPIE